jgi:hypothetical protein
MRISFPSSALPTTVFGVLNPTLPEPPAALDRPLIHTLMPTVLIWKKYFDYGAVWAGASPSETPS